MEIGPIIRALLRNRLGVILIAAQIAFTLTVVVNAVQIITDRAERMARPSGVDENNIFVIRSVGYGNTFNDRIAVAEDLDMIRQLPGVVSATVSNSLPVSDSGSSSGMSTVAGRVEGVIPTAVYTVDEFALRAFGAELIAGRDFTANDVSFRDATTPRRDHSIIVSLAMAESLFPGEGMQAVGRSIYDYNTNPNTVTIIGIVKTFQAPWTEWASIEHAMLIPEVFADSSSMYVIRTEPGRRDALMAEIEERLAASHHTRILRDNRSLTDIRSESYRIDSVMSSVLYTVIATLMFITAMGIVGLAVFGINRRRKQIGTRRALGATRLAVLRYFLLENLLISGVGVIAGAALAIAFNIFLVRTFDMPRIEWYFAPLGMLMLVVLGQLAVIGPAARAAQISPATATRSV